MISALWYDPLVAVLVLRVVDGWTPYQMGLPGKIGEHGSEVQELMRRGEVERVQE